MAAHPGMNRMYYTVRKAFYWTSMVTDIHTSITKRTTCAQNRVALRRHTTPLTLFPATEPLTELSVDIFGPIPASKKGNRFILVITDRFAKLTKCVALRRITAISVASAIIDAWVSAYGPPDRILSDQGPQFMSNSRLLPKHRKPAVAHRRPPVPGATRPAPTCKGRRLMLRPYSSAAADRLEQAATLHRPPELAATSPAVTGQRRRLLPNRR